MAAACVQPTGSLLPGSAYRNCVPLCREKTAPWASPPSFPIVFHFPCAAARRRRPVVCLTARPWGCVSKSVPTACGPAFHPGFSVTKQAQNTQESRRGNTCCVKGCALCWSYRFARADVNNVLGLCCENTLLPLSPSSGEPAGLARCETRRPAGFPCFGVSLGIRGNSRQRCSRLLLRVIQQNCSFCDFALHVSNRWHGVAPHGFGFDATNSSFLMRRGPAAPRKLDGLQEGISNAGPLLHRSELRYKRGMRLCTVVYGTDSRKPEC